VGKQRWRRKKRQKESKIKSGREKRAGKREEGEKTKRRGQMDDERKKVKNVKSVTKEEKRWEVKKP